MTVTTEQLEANKELARDYIDQLFNQRHPDKAADFVTGDVSWHGGGLGHPRRPGEPGRPARGRSSGRCRTCTRLSRTSPPRTTWSWSGSS